MKHRLTLALLLVALPALAQQTPAPKPDPAAQQQRIELLQAQVDKLEAQSALLTQELQPITEFREWVQVQRDLQQKSQQLDALKQPPPAPAAPAPKPPPPKP